MPLKYSVQVFYRGQWIFELICCYLTTHSTDIKEKLTYILSIELKWTDVMISQGDFPDIEENIMNISTNTRKKNNQRTTVILSFH